MNPDSAAEHLLPAEKLTTVCSVGLLLLKFGVSFQHSQKILYRKVNVEKIPTHQDTLRSKRFSYIQHLLNWFLPDKFQEDLLEGHHQVYFDSDRLF